MKGLKINKIFKERLIYTMKNVFEELCIPLIALVVGCFLIYVCVVWFPIIGKIVGFTIIAVFGLILILAILSFIHWLFIEPFKNDIK